jgi:hypothetical protein
VLEGGRQRFAGEIDTEGAQRLIAPLCRPNSVVFVVMLCPNVIRLGGLADNCGSLHDHYLSDPMRRTEELA